LAQDYPSIELLVVDDGSTDRTVDIVRSYGQRIKLIVQKNSGVCAARNRGIQESTGQYICFIDHDDYWYPNKISTQVKSFTEHPETGVVYSDFTLWHPDSSGTFPHPDSIKTAITNDIDEKFSGWIYHLLLLDCWVLTSTAMFCSEVFQKCGVFDETLPYSEDWELFLRLSREFRFLKLNQSTTLYRQHRQQGNRKVRNIDYRTNLLINSTRKWGLCSQNGLCLSKMIFIRQLGEYHSSFGLNHLLAGNKNIAIRSLIKAWITYPLKIKYLAYVLAGLIGWKPNW
jgi:glycosyltransferase involved in cell wall biosynthesis